MSDFWDVIVWMLWFSLLCTWIPLFFGAIADVFTDPELNGGAKALWTLLLLFVPWLGPVIYLVVRGNAMNARSAKADRRRVATSR